MVDLIDTNQTQPLVNYPYEDVRSGTGLELYYLGMIAGNEIISNNQFFSDDTFTHHNPGGTPGTYLDMDFDVTINRAITLRGVGIINIPFTTNNGQDLHLLAYLRKWDGTTETLIATGTGKTFTSTGAGYEKMLGATFSIPTSTTIKKGEVLRVTINIVLETGGYEFWICHDPFDTNEMGLIHVSSTAALQLPIKIDV